MQVKRIIIIWLIMMAIGSSIVSAVGVGIAPATIDVTGILQGSHMQKYITVSNPEDYTEIITMSTSTECSDWITFSPTQLEVGPKGEEVVDVNIQLPNTVEVGEHTCEIRASATATAEGSGMGTTAASVATLNLKVIALEGAEVLELPEEEVLTSNEAGENQILWVALIVGICVIITALAFKYKKRATQPLLKSKHL